MFLLFVCENVMMILEGITLNRREFKQIAQQGSGVFTNDYHDSPLTSLQLLQTVVARQANLAILLSPLPI